MGICNSCDIDSYDRYHGRHTKPLNQISDYCYNTSCPQSYQEKTHYNYQKKSQDNYQKNNRYNTHPYYQPYYSVLPTNTPTNYPPYNPNS